VLQKDAPQCGSQNIYLACWYNPASSKYISLQPCLQQIYFPITLFTANVDLYNLASGKYRSLGSEAIDFTSMFTNLKLWIRTTEYSGWEKWIQMGNRRYLNLPSTKPWMSRDFYTLWIPCIWLMWSCEYNLILLWVLLFKSCQKSCPSSSGRW
jgi:hypothetical protein